MTQPNIAEIAFIELRPDHVGDFDELIARFADGTVHVETLSDNMVWIGFQHDDGRRHRLVVSSKKKLRYIEEDESGPPPRYTAQGVDRRPDLPDYEAIARQHLLTEGEGR